MSKVQHDANRIWGPGFIAYRSLVTVEDLYEAIELLGGGPSPIPTPESNLDTGLDVDPGTEPEDPGTEPEGGIGVLGTADSIPEEPGD